MGSIFKLFLQFYDMFVAWNGSLHSSIVIFFSCFPSACTHKHKHKWAHSENEKRMGLNQCQRHKTDEWYFFGQNPNFCSVHYAGNTLSKWLDWVQNVQTQYLLTYCVWFYRRASVHGCMCVWWWLELSAITAATAKRETLTFKAWSAQNNLLFCAAYPASCMQNRCWRVHVKMPLPISIWVRTTCHIYPSSCRENFDPILYVFTFWFWKKKEKKKTTTAPDKMILDSAGIM